jgi:hypothetical protein
MSKIVRVAAGQGFWGDWLEAPVRQVKGGPIDYLMMDYLAEVTMSIMQKQRARDPKAGYARDFIPLMERILPDVVRKGIKVITNAGGVNPRGCAEAVVAAAQKLGLQGKVRVGLVVGDDILDRLDELLDKGHELRDLDTGRPLSEIRDKVLSANAYLGLAPVVDALEKGANVIVTGRVTDTGAHPWSAGARVRVGTRGVGPHRRGNHRGATSSSAARSRQAGTSSATGAR